MKKKLAVIFTSLMLAMSVACSGGATTTAAAAAETTAAAAETTAAAADATSAAAGETSAAAADTADKTYKIGCTFDYLSDFMSYVTDGVTAYGEEHPNVEVTVQDANFDVAKQLQHVENFINSGYDAIVIKPVDAEGCQTISQACIDADVPLIVVNAEIIGSEYTTYIGSDHILAGNLQAQFVADQLGGKGKVAILQGELIVAAAGMRTDGNEEIIAKYPDMEVVSKQEAMWMRDTAINKTENWINSGLEIDAILANNDEMALGAIIALKASGMDDVLVCGIDATEEALKALKDGDMAMTVFQNGYGQGYQGVEAAVKILNGETVEKYIDVPYEQVLPEQADEYLAKYAN